MPANAVSPAEGAIITGTVRFHEADPDRTVEVFREVGDAWTEDEALETVAAADGSYEVRAPAGEPVKLRVSYGSREYSYWYGDGFGEVTAVPVLAEAGETLPGVDVEVPTTDAPIATSPSGAYTVILPAEHETGIMGVSYDGNAGPGWVVAASPSPTSTCTSAR